MTRSVLLIDDDPDVLKSLAEIFRRSGDDVTTASTGEDGVAFYAADAADLVILDLTLPDAAGLEILARLRALDPLATVIVLTGQADIGTAVDAMKAGAENFLAKPIDIDHLRASADRATEKIDLRLRADYLESRNQDQPLVEWIGESGVMRAVEEKVALVAPSESTALLLGETGTGKSWIARRIHTLSPRRDHPFVEVNCASLTPTFLESELFGHEKGAFTDAKAAKRGLLEIADGGTLFLDEIGDLALDLQPKLLHVLETGRFRRLGGTREIQSDPRLIAATNRDLKAAVEEKRFREDLYYRIAVVPIELPPLRQRDPSDLSQLARTLLETLQTRVSRARTAIAPAALRLMLGYSWPGNIREMRNVLERAIILTGEAPQIQPEHLPRELAGGNAPGSVASRGSVELTLEEVERSHIQRVLEHCDGNRSRAARILGLSRSGLYKKLNRLDGLIAGR